MKNISIFIVLFMSGMVTAQPGFTVKLEPVTINGLPGIQSFIGVRYQHYWLIMGGRNDGLHKRQPMQAFDAAQNNTNIYIVNTRNWQISSLPLDSLGATLKEQLQSTNMQYYLDDSLLIITGGYGFSNTSNNHITYPRITFVNVPNLIQAILSYSGNYSSFFQSLIDQNMAVTGGYLGKIDSTFFLVGGNRFDGRYNPNNGPSFTQVYTNQIRKFTLSYSQGQWQVQNYAALTDAVNLHRRDYNMVPQVFPGNMYGYTAFSGVFQYAANLPYLNSVDIKASGYTVNNTFQQLLNQYHGAFVPMYDSISNIMQTLFLGGIAQFYYNAQDSLIQDNDVPFVNTISLVQRDDLGAMTEYKLPDSMPGLLGASAVFLTDTSAPLLYKSIIQYNSSSPDTVNLGYMIGGIHSSQPNIFFINDGTQSQSSTSVFRVKIIRQAIQGIQVPNLIGKKEMSAQITPNPAKDEAIVRILGLESGKKVIMNLITMTGDRIAIKKIEGMEVDPNKDQSWPLDLRGLESGTYLLVVYQEQRYCATKLVVR